MDKESVKKEMQLKKMLEVCKKKKIKLRETPKSFYTWNKILKNQTKQLQQQTNTHSTYISLQISEFVLPDLRPDTFWSVFTKNQVCASTLCPRLTEPIPSPCELSSVHTGSNSS